MRNFTRTAVKNSLPSYDKAPSNHKVLRYWKLRAVSLEILVSSSL